MFIFELKKLKQQINNTNKNRLIFFKFNYFLIIFFFLINKGRVNGADAQDFDSPSISEIFLIINKTISNEIINNIYYDRISNIKINNKEIYLGGYNDHINNSKLEINYITIIFKSGANLTSCAYMFYNLSNIIYVDLSNLNFNEIRNIEYMFSGCKSLLSIDFGEFETSNKGIDMNNMFSGCISLLSLNMHFIYDS